jgi:catechol 2,3-dioxygenase-like lactoylglutathione lyase family enzyme
MWRVFYLQKIGRGFAMKLGYVVLYVNDATECLNFWTEKVGMVEKGSKQAGPFSIVKVGFADQEFSLELVPLELMKNNPDNLDLATPSIAFYVPSLQQTRENLLEKGVQVTDIADHGGITSFAFIDNEGRGFAVIEA